MKKEEIKVLTAKDVVCKRPKMYWGKDRPTIEDVTTSIIEQLKLEDCDLIEIDDFDRWKIVASSTDWIELNTSEGCNVRDIFIDAKGFPIGGGNALRFEFFLYLLASELIVWSSSSLSVIKGSLDNQLEEYVKDKFSTKTCICYVLKNT